LLQQLTKKPSAIAEKMVLRQKQRKLDLLTTRIYICFCVWTELLFVLKKAKGFAFEGFFHRSLTPEAP
jgi:hypothetical protein